MTSYFKLQPLAQQIQTSMMNQAADITFSKLGYCPAFLASQEPINADTKLKVVNSVAMDNHSKDFPCAGHLSKSDNSSISATSTNDFYFSMQQSLRKSLRKFVLLGFDFLHIVQTWQPFCFSHSLCVSWLSVCKRIRRKYSTDISVSDSWVRR